MRMLALGIALVLATEPVATEPVATEPVAARRERAPGDRMVQAGVGVVVAGILGYGLMAAGLGIGNRAEGDLLALSERDDIPARRDVLARGRLGNQLAIAGAVTASVAMAVGIPLIVIGRRRHESYLGGPSLVGRLRRPKAYLGGSSPRARLVIGGGPGSWGLEVQGRF